MILSTAAFRSAWPSTARQAHTQHAAERGPASFRLPVAGKNDIARMSSTISGQPGERPLQRLEVSSAPRRGKSARRPFVLNVTSGPKPPLDGYDCCAAAFPEAANQRDLSISGHDSPPSCCLRQNPITTAGTLGAGSRGPSRKQAPRCALRCSPSVAPTPRNMLLDRLR